MTVRRLETVGKARKDLAGCHCESENRKEALKKYFGET